MGGHKEKTTDYPTRSNKTLLLLPAGWAGGMGRLGVGHTRKYSVLFVRRAVPSDSFDMEEHRPDATMPGFGLVEIVLK